MRVAWHGTHRGCCWEERAVKNPLARLGQGASCSHEEDAGSPKKVMWGKQKDNKLLWSLPCSPWAEQNVYLSSSEEYGLIQFVHNTIDSWNDLHFVDCHARVVPQLRPWFRTRVVRGTGGSLVESDGTCCGDIEEVISNADIFQYFFTINILLFMMGTSYPPPTALPQFLCDLHLWRLHVARLISRNLEAWGTRLSIKR